MFLKVKPKIEKVQFGRSQCHLGVKLTCPIGWSENPALKIKEEKVKKENDIQRGIAGTCVQVHVQVADNETGFLLGRTIGTFTVSSLLAMFPLAGVTRIGKIDAKVENRFPFGKEYCIQYCECFTEFLLGGVSATSELN